MTKAPPLQPVCLPPAPSNGGDLTHAPTKVGEWVWQPKVDDWRCVIHTPSRTVWNQYGKLSTVADQNKLELALDHLERLSFAAEWLDAGIMENRHDMMRGSIIVFDLIEPEGDYNLRRARLASMFETLLMASALLAGGNCRDHVYLVNDWRGDALKFYLTLKHENAKLGRKFYEGVVAKRIDALYPTYGRSPKIVTPNWIKHRFDQDASNPLAPFYSFENVTAMFGVGVAQ